MPKKLIKPGILLATVFVVISLLFVTAGAATVDVLDGQVTVADSLGNNSVSDGTVTITAKGSLFGKKTNNITITNETDSQAQLTFDYSASNANSFKIAGTAANASGSYTVILDAGASLAITLVSNSGLSNTTATLTLSNFSLTVVADSSNVTINYDSTLGSVTAGGNSAANGAVIEGVTKADGVVLAATPASGATFLGWVDGSSKILSSDATYTLKPASNMTVKAAFASNAGTGTPWFGVGAATQKSESSGLLGMSKIEYYIVGTSYLFDDLNAAAAKAASDVSNKCVVLMNSGTLSAGTYTIPSGVTLLIPFDSANTMYTTKVVNTKDKDWVKPTEYRTLTMADGANLTINGAMSISAKQATARGSKVGGGSPTGPVSFVKMEGNSSITVENGGTLYAYGFITGSGSVTAKNGATVYECFQIMDFRGGTQSKDMENGVFPFSQYYVQNIEVPMKLYSGAKEYAYTTIYMSSTDFGTAVNFIGSSNAMFNLTSGYVVKQYDGTTDRMMIEVNGNLSVSAVTLDIGTSSINSKNYDLPINSNITVTAKSGSITIDQDLAFLPGSVMEIKEGVTCTLGKGYNVYIYDADEWGDFCYSKSANLPLLAISYAPGKTYTRTAADLVDATFQVDGIVDASAGYLYTTAGGANICSTGNGVVKLQAGAATVTYQLKQVGKEYVQIPITLAKLKNADGAYTGEAAGEYTYIDGLWHKDCNGEVTTTIVDATCEEPGSITKACSCEAIKNVEEISALGHTEVIDAAVAATCTTTGLTEGKHCSVCGTVIVAQTEIPALGHSYNAVVTEPTCTEQGYTTHTCACGDSYTDGYVDAKGHSFSVKTTGDNTQTHKCERCDVSVTLHISFRLDDYVWFNGYFEESFMLEDSVTVSDLTETVKTAISRNAGRRYVVKALAAKEIPLPMQIRVDFVCDGKTYTCVFNVSLSTYNAGEDEALYQALLSYGAAAEDYFGEQKLPAEKDNPADPNHSTIRPVEGQGAITFGDESKTAGISTSGATIYFDEALRLSVQYHLSGFSLETVDGVSTAKVTINGEKYSIVQLGLLVKTLTEEDIVEVDGKRTMSQILTTGSGNCTAYLAYNTVPSKNITSGGANNYPYFEYGGEDAADQIERRDHL